MRIRQEAQALASTAWGCVTLGKELNLSEPETTVVAEVVRKIPCRADESFAFILSHHPTVME